MEGMDIDSVVKNNTDVTIETTTNDPALRHFRREILDTKIDIIKNRIKDLEKKKIMLLHNTTIQELERQKIVLTGQSNQNKSLDAQQDFLPQIEGPGNSNELDPPYWKEPTYTMPYSKCNFPPQDTERNMREDHFLPSAKNDQMIVDNRDLDWLEPSDWRRSLSWRDSLKNCLLNLDFYSFASN